jgi:hypothetical protein
MTVTISVRPARAEDVPTLVQLRLANAERHAGLDPAGHRRPEIGAVRQYFSELLSGQVAAAEQHAAQHGVTCLLAPILESNAEAVTFYSHSGFGPHGIILSKELAPEASHEGTPW